MRRFLKIIFNRMTFVAVAIILQLIISILFPYILSFYYPFTFNNIYIPIDTVLKLIAIILMLRVINSDMTVEGKMPWIILFLWLPIIGIVLYVVFVRPRPISKLRQYCSQLRQEISPYLRINDCQEIEFKNGLGDYYGQFKYIHNSTGYRVYGNTDTKFLPTGRVFFEELKHELNKAKRYIFMEYFIIEQGQMWNEIYHILREKISEGVEVRLMYDDIGTIHKLPSRFSRDLERLGVKCVKFNSFVPIVSAFHNNRDHRKMTIIDGKIGFMSGLNIADEYINLKQPFGYWKDTGIKIVGEAVKSMVLMYLELFDVQSRQTEDISKYMPSDISTINPSGYVCPFGDGPRYFCSEQVAVNVFLNLINQAKRYIWITSPYLIIDSKLNNALCNAAMRGVSVKIITPRIPDKQTIFKITRSNYKNLMLSGVKIYEFTKGFIHSKQILVDDDIAFVGTINMDYRSLLHHFECGILLCKTSSLRVIRRDFVQVLSLSEDMCEFKQSAFTRLYCALLKVFTPIL